MDVTIDQFSTYIGLALKKVGNGKYRDIVVKGSPTGIEIRLEAQHYHVRNPATLKAEAQTRFEELFECNPGYSDLTYLAAVAYEETIKKYPAYGRSITTT